MNIYESWSKLDQAIVSQEHQKRVRLGCGQLLAEMCQVIGTGWDAASKQLPCPSSDRQWHPFNASHQVRTKTTATNTIAWGKHLCSCCIWNAINCFYLFQQRYCWTESGQACRGPHTPLLCFSKHLWLSVQTLFQASLLIFVEYC